MVVDTLANQGVHIEQGVLKIDDGDLTLKAIA